MEWDDGGIVIGYEGIPDTPGTSVRTSAGGASGASLDDLLYITVIPKIFLTLITPF